MQGDENITIPVEKRSAPSVNTTEVVTLDTKRSVEGMSDEVAWPLSEIAVEIEVAFDILFENVQRFANGAFTESVSESAMLNKLYTETMDEITTAYCHGKGGRDTAVGAARRAMAMTMVLCWWIKEGSCHQARLANEVFDSE